MSERWLVIAIGVAVCLMGEQLAGAMLLLGYEVGVAHGRRILQGEP